MVVPVGCSYIYIYIYMLVNLVSYVYTHCGGIHTNDLSV